MIDATEADRLADMIANATGRGWTDDAVHLLGREIESWRDPGSAYATADWFTKHWVEEWRPTTGQIWAKYNEAAHAYAKAEARKGATDRPQCDGSGWVDGIVPCKRCNPYVRDLFDEPLRWEQFMDGTKLSDLNDQVTVSDKKMVGGHGMPTPCKRDLFHDPAAAIVAPLVGYEFARRGYALECADQGREPNWKYFEDTMSGLLGIAKTPPEPAVVPSEPRTAPPPPPAPAEALTAVEKPGSIAQAIAETVRNLDEDF